MVSIALLIFFSLFLSLSFAETHNRHPSTHADSDGYEAYERRHLAGQVRRSIGRREIITTEGLSSSYDFIIAGGGLAGLVLASRLSEDSNKTVLVVEAGDTGDAVQSSISIPGNCYWNSLENTDYDWQYSTVPQKNLVDRVLDWPRGRVLGGSSAMNGLYLVRPSKIECDAWSSLSESTTTNWNWASMLESMTKSETFTAPSDAIAAQGNIEYNASIHGESGPLDYSYPGWLPELVSDWVPALEEIGIPECPEPNAGEGWGSFVATSCINPSNMTRSYSRSAYIDPLPPRDNLHILPNTRVMSVNTQTNTDGTVTATGITYQTGPGATSETVRANLEVILCGGAIGSPQLLMLSGIGPAANINAVGLTSVIDLPGVGQNAQDHLSGQVIWTTNSTTASTINANATLAASIPDFDSFINSATSYINTSALLGSSDAAMLLIQEIAENYTWAMENASPSTDPTVLAGYAAVYNLTVNEFMTSPIGQIEIILGLTGTSQGGDQSIAIQAALQHPLSRGQITLNTSSAWDYPNIDPNYLSHPADLILLREGLKFARSLFYTDAFAPHVVAEVSPGAGITSDADIEASLMTTVVTEYHPGCTCGMMPYELGGVVDEYLVVYNTTNLRVVDASVFPFEFSAHLQAPTYGLAEKAADLIKKQYWASSETGTNTTTNAGIRASASSSSYTTHSSLPSSVSSTATSAAGKVDVKSGQSAFAVSLAVAAFLLWKV